MLNFRRYQHERWLARLPFLTQVAYLTDVNTYYLRCIESDIATLLALGKTLGALADFTDPDTHVVRVVAAQGGCLDVIGRINDQATGLPKADAGGAIYWHANLLTPLDLRDVADAMSASNPAIAAGLADLTRFFIVDPQTWHATAPAQPVRVWL